jgi:hypothetical protein
VSIGWAGERLEPPVRSRCSDIGPGEIYDDSFVVRGMNAVYKPIDHGGGLYADPLRVSPRPDEDVVDPLVDLLTGLDGRLRVAGRDGYGCRVAAGGGPRVDEEILHRP